MLSQLGHPILRAHFRYSRSSENYWETVTTATLPEAERYIERRSSTERANRIVCSDPERCTIYRYSITAKQSSLRLQGLEIRKMVELASDAICLLRNPDGDIVGMSASLPIHEGTLPYLLQSPVSAPYLRTLASEQLQSLRTAPDRPAGRFIYAIDAIDLERRELRSDIVHLVFDHILAGSLLIEVPPALPYYVDSRNSMGYTEIAARNPYIYGDGTPAVTYVLDTRGPKLGIWFDQVAGAGMKAAVSPTSNASEQSGTSDWNRELPRRKLPELTPREQEVAELLAQGATNREIAGKLYISEAGVKKHVNGMLQKTGLKNRTQFVAALLETKK